LNDRFDNLIMDHSLVDVFVSCTERVVFNLQSFWS
jgi:hypothetical protein